MSQSRVLVLLAGAALSIGAPALAQNANLDKDRAYAAELMADASNRSSGLNRAGTAGYDKGMAWIGDGTGDNTLSIGGTAQVRYNMNFRDKKNDNAGNGGKQRFTHGFSFGDVRLHAHGNVFSQDLKYKVRGNFNSADGNIASSVNTIPAGFDANGDGNVDAGDTTSFVTSNGFALEDAYMAYSFENGFSVKAGQFRMPLTRAWSVEDEFQLAVDRSQTDYFFSSGYTQGIQAEYGADMWRMMAGFTDGFGSVNGAAPSNSPFNSPNEADFALHARVEVMFAGTGWDRWNDFTSWRSSEGFAAMIGASAAYQMFGETGGMPTPAKGKEIAYNVDVSFEGPGWNAMAAFNGLTFDPDNSNKLTDFGFEVQGGYFVANQWEIFARYDVLRLDKDRGAASRTQNIITGGVNYYLSPDSHAAKFTANVVFAANKTIGGPAGGNRTGLQGDVTSGEMGVGFQFQVMF